MDETPFPETADWGAPRLRWMSAADAREARRLHVRRADLAFALGDRTLTVAVVPTRDGDGADASTKLAIRIGSGLGTIELSRDLTRFLLDRIAPGMSERHPDVDLPLEAALETPLAALEEVLGIRVALLPKRDVAAAASRAIDVRVSEGGRTVGHCRFVLATVERNLLIETLERRPPAPRNVDDLPLPITVTAGTARLTPSVLKSLRRGDIVLADDAVRETPVEILVAGRPFMTGVRAENGFLIIGVDDGRIRGRTLMDDSVDSPLEPIRLDELPLPVTFEIGRREMTLGELRSVRPGYVLEITRDSAIDIDLVVRGRIIGKAELVQIENLIGARVLRLFDDE